MIRVSGSIGEVLYLTAMSKQRLHANGDTFGQIQVEFNHTQSDGSTSNPASNTKMKTVHRPVRARRSRPFFQRIPKQSIP